MDSIPKITTSQVLTYEVVTVFIFKQLQVLANVGVIEGCNDLDLLQEVSKISDASLRHLLDGSLKACDLVQTESRLAIIGVADDARDVVVIKDALTMLMNDHLCRFVLVDARKASTAAGVAAPVFDSLTQQLLKVDHGVLDDVLLPLDTLAHHLLSVVLEDFREVVRHKNLLGRENSHLSNVRHDFIYSKLFNYYI